MMNGEWIVLTFDQRGMRSAYTNLVVHNTPMKYKIRGNGEFSDTVEDLGPSIIQTFAGMLPDPEVDPGLSLFKQLDKLGVVPSSAREFVMANHGGQLPEDSPQPDKAITIYGGGNVRAPKGITLLG